ncbi:MAG: hypothetical protein AAF587_37835 [Bacteroidota bacterium]
MDLPSQRDLNALFSNSPVSEVRIRYFDFHQSRNEPSEVFQIDDKETIDQFISCIKISGHSPGLRSIPDTYIDIFSNEVKVEEFAFLFKQSLRWNKWREDGIIASPDSLIQLFRDIGFTKPWERELATQKRLNDKIEEIDRWKRTAPKSFLRHIPGLYFEPVHRITPDPISEELLVLMIKEVRKEMWVPKKRVRKMIELFGLGGRRWVDNWPPYDMVPLFVLLNEPIQTILKGISRKPLSPDQLNGLGRFLSHWTFLEHRKSDLQLIPQKIYEQIHTYVLDDKDEGKISFFENRVLNKLTFT